MKFRDLKQFDTFVHLGQHVNDGIHIKLHLDFALSPHTRHHSFARMATMVILKNKNSIMFHSLSSNTSIVGTGDGLKLLRPLELALIKTFNRALQLAFDFGGGG